MAKKKQTKTEQFEAGIRAIYEDTSLNILEAIYKFDEFLETQKFLKRGKYKFSNFVAGKVFNDYIAKDMHPKSLLEYKAGAEYALACMEDYLKSKYFLKCSTSLHFYFNDYNKCIKERFKKLNPNMVLMDELLRAFIYIPNDNPLNRQMLQQLNDLQEQIEVKGNELLIRLPVFQEYLLAKYNVEVVCLPSFREGKTVFELKYLAVGTYEQRLATIKWFKKNKGIDIL